MWVSREHRRVIEGWLFCYTSNGFVCCIKAAKCAKSAYFPLDYLLHRHKKWRNHCTCAFWLYLFAIKGEQIARIAAQSDVQHDCDSARNVNHFDGIDAFAHFLIVHSVAMLSSDCYKIGHRWYESHANAINTANCVTIFLRYYRYNREQFEYRTKLSHPHKCHKIIA